MKNVITFLYHEATDEPSSTGFQRSSALPYKHSVREFKRNIDVIVANTLKFSTVYNIESNSTLLTFDDGGKSALDIADYLDKKDIKGHFFITTGMIGDPCFLNEKEILDLHNRGHIIGSHSHNHPNVFKSLNKNQMLNEWTKSKSVLEGIIGEEILCCSVPGGDSSNETIRTAISSGYKIIFDSEPVLNIRKLDKSLILGRICPKSGTKISKVEAFSQGKGVRSEYLKRRIKVYIKTIIFPLYVKVHNSRKHEKQS
ncbi:polysaccharide deacetylase family protein [Schleiferiaceae bacterium]|nr:polysaccharide deacetylase family protein [Schleiferiaceae bacterium]